MTGVQTCALPISTGASLSFDDQNTIIFNGDDTTNIGSNNIVIGYQSGKNITGSNNTLIGNITREGELNDTIILAAGTTERMVITDAGLFINGEKLTVTNTENTAYNDVTQNRMLNVIYTNTRPISIYVYASISLNPYSSVELHISDINNIKVASNTTASAIDVPISIKVLPNTTYMISCTGGEINSWIELI